jgi:hypothetical protein
MAKIPLQLQQLTSTYLDLVQSRPQHSLEKSERRAIFQSFGALGNLEQRASAALSETDRAYAWLGVITARKVLPIWQAARIKLAASAAENRGIIEEEFDKQYSYIPQKMLELAEGYLRGTLSYQEAKVDLCTRFYYGIIGIDRITTKNIYCAMYASYATLEATIAGIESLNNDFAGYALTAYAATDENEPGLWIEDNLKRNQDKMDEWLASDDAPTDIKEAFAQLADVKLEDIFPSDLAKTLHEHKAEHIRKANAFIPLKYDVERELEFWQWWLTVAIEQAWELADPLI